jgi:hypothetical protein
MPLEDGLVLRTPFRSCAAPMMSRRRTEREGEKNTTGLATDDIGWEKGGVRERGGDRTAAASVVEVTRSLEGTGG